MSEKRVELVEQLLTVVGIKKALANETKASLRDMHALSGLPVSKIKLPFVSDDELIDGYVKANENGRAAIFKRITESELSDTDLKELIAAFSTDAGKTYCEIRLASVGEARACIEEFLNKVGYLNYVKIYLNLHAYTCAIIKATDETASTKEILDKADVIIRHNPVITLKDEAILTLAREQSEVLINATNPTISSLNTLIKENIGVENKKEEKDFVVEVGDKTDNETKNIIDKAQELHNKLHTWPVPRDGDDDGAGCTVEV